MHAVTRYFNALESLKALRGFLQDDTLFRFAALPLSELDPLPAPAAIWEAAGQIESRGGIVRPLALVAAAVFARRKELEPGIASLARHTIAVRDFLGAWGQAGGATAFALALGIRTDNPIPVLERARSVHELWRRDHSWLTGDDDWPLAAWHASQGSSPGQVAAATEEAWRGLLALGFGRGNAAQLAAQVLALGNVPELLHRVALLQGALRDRKQEWALMDAVALSLLVITPGQPADLARDMTLRTDSQLQGADPPARMTAVSLAALMVSREHTLSHALDDFLTLRIAALVAAWRELGA